MTNASVADTSVEFARVNISDKITFDAMTIELPIVKVQRTSFNADSVSPGPNYTMAVEEYCSRDGCVTPSVIFENIYGWDTMVQPQVLAAGICVNDDGSEDLVFRNYTPNSCPRNSNSSMLILSIGMRIDGDLWDKRDGSKAKPEMQFTNQRIVYSVTVERLS